MDDLYATAPKPSYSRQIRVRYRGERKIAAIKALRAVFGLDLKSAKDIVEWWGGFLTTPEMLAQVIREYTDNAFHSGGSITDWETITPLPDPVQL